MVAVLGRSLHSSRSSSVPREGRTTATPSTWTSMKIQCASTERPALDCLVISLFYDMTSSYDIDMTYNRLYNDNSYDIDMQLSTDMQLTWQWHMMPSQCLDIVTSVIDVVVVVDMLSPFIFQFLQLGSGTLPVWQLSGTRSHLPENIVMSSSFIIGLILFCWLTDWWCGSSIWRATCSLQVFTLPQMETFVVVPGESGRMSTIIGNRKNLHHSGTTSGNSLQECSKSNLKDVPLLPTPDKHKILGTARVKDESRATTGARGRELTLEHVFNSLKVCFILNIVSTWLCFILFLKLTEISQSLFHFVSELHD